MAQSHRGPDRRAALVRTTWACLVAAICVDTAASAAPMPSAAEVIVVADPFARWDGTRWHVQTSVLLPVPGVLYAREDHELWFDGYDLRVVLACELGDKVRPKAMDAECIIEDAALSVLARRTASPQADHVLAETVADLKTLAVRLLVTADGRVESLTLMGENEDNRRRNIRSEVMRVMLSRPIAGYHLTLPTSVPVGEVWAEYDSRLFVLTPFRILPSQARERPMLDRMLAPRSLGGSRIIHRVDLYKGQYVAQSEGEAAFDLSEPAEMALEDGSWIDVSRPITYKGVLHGVGIFQASTGILSERVWHLDLEPTAGSAFAEGGRPPSFVEEGRLRMLGKDEEVELGPSVVKHR